MIDPKPTSSKGKDPGNIEQDAAPFHCFKAELPPKSEIQGSVDLLGAYDLGGFYHRFCQSRRLREDLSSFLPHLYGNFNFSASQDASSLKNLVEKPPIRKEITKLSNSAMQGFRLNTGPVDERYRHLFERKRDVPDNQLVHDERREIIRVKNTLEPLKAGKDPYEDGIGNKKKHKKSKKSKKEKKKKRDHEERAPNGSVPSQDDSNFKRGPDMMEF